MVPAKLNLFSCSSEEISIRILSNIYHRYQLKIVRIWNFLVSIFHIWTEYWSISPYSLRMRGNADQKNSFCYSKNIFEVILEFKVLSYLQFSKKDKIYSNRSNSSLINNQPNIISKNNDNFAMERRSVI